jgi:hypothetical protein
MRRHYGIALEEEEDLLEDLGQVRVLGEVGMEKGKQPPRPELL